MLVERHLRREIQTDPRIEGEQGGLDKKQTFVSGCLYLACLWVDESLTGAQVANAPLAQGAGELVLEGTLYNSSTPQGVHNSCKNNLGQPLLAVKVVCTLDKVRKATRSRRP